MESLFFKSNPVCPSVQLCWEDCRLRAEAVATRVMQTFPKAPCRIYGVPRGGIPAALLVQNALHQWGYYSALSENPEDCPCIIDDLIDSGKTKESYLKNYLGISFFTLVDKQGKDAQWNGSWISFPWERQSKEGSIQDNIIRVLEWIGEDPNRDGLKETPDRVIRSYGELFAGYRQSPESLMKVFDGDIYDEMVLLKGCEFTSFCEHHLLPFSGFAHIAYIPEENRVIGLSKLARLLDIYAKRLQLQERLTCQVTQALGEYLKPKGSACVIEATHSCLSCRGARKQSARMVTSSLTGAFRLPEVRAEFFQLVR